jgi:polysaccharide export outer membrane protein
MKKPSLSKSFFVLVAAGAVGVSAWAQDVVAPYKLRPADRLQVSVWREEALQREVRVLPDGSITFPLVGRLPVAGLDTEQVEKRIAERLKTFIPDPIVTVAISGTDGNIVYVLGKVAKPGVVPLTADTTTVLQVLSQAGGLDRFADGNAVRVLREEGGQRNVLAVRYNDLIKGDSLQTNVPLRAGDTVLVP